MAWTVPNGCYYAVYTTTWVYYNAGASVPTENAPNKSGGNTFVLLDFSNGYIYNGATLFAMTLDITANNTFTVTSISPLKIKGPCYVYATKPTSLTLTGTQFTFGNGSGLLNKTAFMHSESNYYMNSAFKGRTDITSVTIPSGVYGMNSCFDGCTSLTTVSAIPNSVIDMPDCFMGCVSLAGNIVVSNNPSSSSYYAGLFEGTKNDIYIVDDNAGSVWKNSIAPSYSNVHYEADDNTVPSVSMSVTRVDSALSEVQTPTGEYAYINAQVQLYEDYMPVGWSNTLNSTDIKKDGTTQTVTWTETEVGLLYTLKGWINLGDVTKHTFTLQVTDRIDDENNTQKASHLSAIVTQILSKAYKLVDYYHESDQTDPNYDTEGFAIGKYAEQANLFDVDMPSLFRDSTTCKDMTAQEVDDFIDNLNVGTGGGGESSTLTVVKGTVGTKNYCKKVGYIVFFYIELTGISWASGWNTLATLPTGYIPTDYFDFAGIDNTNDTACHGKVTAGGEVQVYKTSSLSNNIRLNGMFIV